MSPRITNRVSSYGWPSWSMLVCQTSSTGTPGRRCGALISSGRGIRALTTWQHDLAASLGDFNALYGGHGDYPECADLIQEAMGEVARTATAAAIFTLGLSQRARQAARQN